MKPLSQLTKEDIKEVKIVMFDCDGVTVEKGTELKAKETNTYSELYVKTNVISDRMVEKLNRLKKHFIVGFSSGRSLMYLEQAYAKVLDNQVILQGENGLITLFRGELIQTHVFTADEMDKIRNFKRYILSIDNDNICGFEPKQFLITVHCKDRVPEIEYGVPEGLYCLWNGEAYDIGVSGFDKGFGLLDITEGDVESIAVGNGENDKPMLDAATYGVTTDPSVVKSDFYTEKSLDLGGEELIDKLLSLVE